MTLSNDDDLPVTGHDGVSFTLANPDPDGAGIVVTITGGSDSGQVDVVYEGGDIDDDTGSFANSIASVSGDSDSEFENLITTGSTDVDIDYDVEIDDLTPEAQGGDVSVDEDDLPAGSDGSQSTTQQGTFTISAPDGPTIRPSES